METAVLSSASSLLSVASSRLGTTTAQERRGKSRSKVLQEELRNMQKYMLSHTCLEEAKAKIQKAQEEEETAECLTLLSSMSTRPAAVLFPREGVIEEDFQLHSDDPHVRSDSVHLKSRFGRTPLLLSSVNFGAKESLRGGRGGSAEEIGGRRSKEKQHLEDSVQGRFIYKNEHTRQVLSSSGAAVQHALQALTVLTESNVDLEEEERALQRSLEELKERSEIQKLEMQRLAATIKKAQGQASFEEGQVVFRPRIVTSATASRKKKKASHGVHSFLDAEEAAKWRGGRWRAPQIASQQAYGSIPPL